MSVVSEIIRYSLWLTPMRRILKGAFSKPPRGGGALHPDKFSAGLSTDAWQVDGVDLVTIETNENADRPLNHVFFLHGGAYVLEGNSQHRKLIERLANDGLRVTYIDYPLGPECGVVRCHQVVRKA